MDNNVLFEKVCNQFLMDPIRPFNVVCCESIKGRQAPIGGVNRPKQNGSSFQTPNLIFENKESEPTLKIRKPVIPKRSSTSIDRSSPQKSVKYKEGQYAICFEDSTWAHTDAGATDHYASREEIFDVAQKFDSKVDMIISEGGIEQASAIQSATDLLLNELATMLRCECREQCELVERARSAYALVFSLLKDDSKKCREMINELEQQKSILDENLTKVIDNATERVKETQLDCERQIQDMKTKMDEKKEEYDNSMKRFLEQKSQLEEHVKALHRVFLDFQSDSVYITLEELKQKQQAYEKKLRNKETEISKLKNQLNKLQKTIQDGVSQRNMLEQANDELRRKLQVAMAQKNRLQRRIDMQNIVNESEAEPEDEQEEGSHNSSNVNQDDLPDKPLINPEAVQDSAQGIKVKRKKLTAATVDSTPYIVVIQKLNQIADRVTDVLTRYVPNFLIPQSTNEEADKVMLSGNPSLMIKAVQLKTNELIQITDNLENIRFDNNNSTKAGNTVSIKNVPRFIQYISIHNKNDDEKGKEDAFSKVTIKTVRQIFNAKYLSDKWNHRMNHPLERFPEFVISYFCKDSGNVFIALSRAARLWRSVEGSQMPELVLFRDFLKEKLTIDELSLFLESRDSLLGQTTPSESDPHITTIQYKKCEDYMGKLLGAFSPVLTTISQEAEKYCVNGYIDYAHFLTLLLSFYENERKRRRNAIRLMFQSKNLSNGEIIDFETFIGIIESLGFKGPFTDVFALYREAILYGSGTPTYDSIVKAMDSLSFHFYTIEVPVESTKNVEITKLTKQQLIQHWVRFGSWFSAFRQPMPKFDPWLRSQLINQVKKVDEVFKSTASAGVLYTHYRELLDFFQYSLDVLARSQNTAMPQNKSERHLSLLENVIDLLVTFVIRDGDNNMGFSESL